MNPINIIAANITSLNIFLNKKNTINIIITIAIIVFDCPDNIIFFLLFKHLNN